MHAPETLADFRALMSDLPGPDTAAAMAAARRGADQTARGPGPAGGAGRMAGRLAQPRWALDRVQVAAGPAHILKRNKMAAVILSEVDYQRLLDKSSQSVPGMSALEWLVSQPNAGERSKAAIDADLQSARLVIVFLDGICTRVPD